MSEKKENWATIRNRIIRQAELVHADVLGQQGQHSTSNLMYEAQAEAQRDGISMTQALGRFIWRNISPDVKEASEVRLAEGIFGIVPHTWFVVELVGDPQAPPDWRYIIDPCCPDVRPQILLISPESPLQILYQERKVTSGNQEGS